MYIKRERYLEKIRPFYDADLIKVLTGVRRCGKSVLLEQIEEELRAEGYDDEHIIFSLPTLGSCSKAIEALAEICIKRG